MAKSVKNADQPLSTKELTIITIYYVVACAIAWPVFLNMDYFHELLRPIDIFFVNPFLIIMWGPGVATILVYLIYGKNVKRSYSFFGERIKLSLLFFFIPWIISSIVNLIFNNTEEQSLSEFLYIIPVAFIFTLGEELGWRGFLQDSLAGISRFKKWFLIAVMWEIWHIRFMWIDDSILKGIMKTGVFFIGTLILSIILGELQEKTKSLLIPITVHISANMLFQNPNWLTAGSLAISIFFWYLIIKEWNSKKISHEL